METALGRRVDGQLARWGVWTVMAATLTELRSRLLLPPDAPMARAAVEEAEALRRQLLDQAQMRNAAATRPVRTAAGPVETVGSKLPLSENFAEARPSMNVFQVAAHEEVITLYELYKICETAREILRGKHEVGRVIARPFIGSPGSFTRTPNRHDYAVPPPKGMLLDQLEDQP